MKLLVVTNDFPPRVGGVNYYVAHLVGRFPRGEVTVLAPDWPGAEAFDHSFPHRVVRWAGRSLYPTPAARQRVEDLVREERPDLLLFGASAPLALMGRPLLRRTGVPYATFTHGVEIWLAQLPVATALLRHMAREAALVTCVSHWQADLLRRAVGPGPRIELLPPGIEAGTFHPGVSDSLVRARHDLGDAPVIGCVSRLTLRKGQDMVIRALPAVADEVPGVRFLVVGSGRDYGRLRALARRKRVEDRVVFAGEIPYDQLPAYFRAGDVFAMPCRTRKWGLEVEAYGGVYLQAAAVGRPSVAGDSGGAPEAVLDGETGVVVDGTKPESVAEGLIALLRDPDRAAKLGARGADRVRRELTWDALSARLRGVLIDALRSSP